MFGFGSRKWLALGNSSLVNGKDRGGSRLGFFLSFSFPFYWICLFHLSLFCTTSFFINRCHHIRPSSLPIELLLRFISSTIDLFILSTLNLIVFYYSLIVVFFESNQRRFPNLEARRVNSSSSTNNSSLSSQSIQSRASVPVTSFCRWI